MENKEASPESIQIAMQLAWQDHQHARDQTWKTVEIEAVLIVAMIGVDWQIDNAIATIAAGIIVVVTTIFGMLITYHHRKNEIRKFTHITNCEKALGLHRHDLLPEDTCVIPEEIKWHYLFLPHKRNTSLHILRLHFALMAFSLLYILAIIV